MNIFAARIFLSTSLSLQNRASDGFGFTRDNMRINELKLPMPKEVSAFNTYWLVQYLQKYHSDLDLQQLIDRIAETLPCYVENLQNGVLEQVSLAHLQNPRYWFSHMFVKSLHDLIEEQVPDPRLGFKIGSTIYRTQPVVRTTLGLSLLGVHRVAKRVSKEAAKYNRTKTYSIQHLSKGRVGLRITHDPGIVISEFTMQWNAGCFASYARLAGATNISVDLHCVYSGPENPGDPEKAIWDFTIQYRDPGLPTRLAKAILFTLPWVRALSEQAAIVEAEHQEQILNRDSIIKEQTDRLLGIQHKLIDEERESIEKKLQDISRELASTEERERRSIAEDLHDSVTQLLALSLSKVKSVQHSGGDIDEIEEIKDNLELALTDLRSLTFQISPPVLYDFGLEAALEWLVTDINSRQDMHLLFVNLLDSPINTGSQQKVTLYRAIRELVINILKHGETREGQIILSINEDNLVAEVEDEGIGFDPQKITQGFGLFSLKDRLLHLNGDLTIDSTPGEGTVVQISVPLEQMTQAPPSA